MLKVGGMPIIEHIIKKAALEGFENFVISVNYMSDVIMKYLGDGRNLGVKISYLQEDKPLGTAGALPIELNR